MIRTVFIAVALLALPACERREARADDTPSALPDRDPALAKELVEEKGAVLLDVRTQQEWEAGHLDGATHIPVQQLERRMGELEALTDGSKDEPIVVYCRSGARAGKAKDMLTEAGYRKVTNLGGMSDWPQ